MADTSKVPAFPIRRAGFKVVLVVEDDISIRAIVSKSLQAKFDVYEASDGLVASEILSRMPKPDLLICDVMMPNVDGFTFVRMLKSDNALKGLPIIFLTAKSAPSDVVKGIQLGAKYYLQKPFNVSELVDKVTKMLAAPGG
jgi:DNA-binding response OmpR family regulator